MPIKPTDSVAWATDANYPSDGGPGAGMVTKTAPSPTRKARGWRPRQKPPAQNLNWWMNRVGSWVSYLDTATPGKLAIPASEFRPTNLAAAQCTYNPSGAHFGSAYSGWRVDTTIALLGSLRAPLQIPPGARITQVEIGQIVNGGCTAGMGILTLATGATANYNIGDPVVLNGTVAYEVVGAADADGLLAIEFGKVYELWYTAAADAKLSGAIVTFDFEPLVP